MKIILNDGKEIRIDEIRSIDMKKDEILVIKINSIETYDVINRIRLYFEKFFKESKVILIDENAEIFKIRDEKELKLKNKDK